MKTDAQKIKTQERRKLVLEMRKDGAKYIDIVRAVKEAFPEEDLPRNYDERQAYQDVKRELDKLRTDVSETAEEIKNIEAMRLEELFEKHFKLALEGEKANADVCLKIHEKIMRLHGLDVDKIEHKGTLNLVEVIKAANGKN